MEDYSAIYGKCVGGVTQQISPNEIADAKLMINVVFGKFGKYSWEDLYPENMVKEEEDEH